MWETAATILATCWF